jgi:hypothetical protein
VLKIKYLKRLPMDKITKKSADTQEKNKFSFPKGRFSKSVHVDFDAPCISSNGGLALCDMRGSLAAKIGQVITLILLVQRNSIENFHRRAKRLRTIIVILRTNI